MELKLRKFSTIHIIDIYDNMDLYNSHRLKELMEKMLAKDIREFVIDLSHVDYIDSSGIGVLIHVFNQAKKQDYSVFMSGVQGSVKKVIELTRLSNFLPLVSTVEEGISAIKKQKGA